MKNIRNKDKCGGGEEEMIDMQILSRLYKQ